MSDFLALELQVTLGCLPWVLGSKLGSSAKAVSTSTLTTSPSLWPQISTFKNSYIVHHITVYI